MSEVVELYTTQKFKNITRLVDCDSGGMIVLAKDKTEDRYVIAATNDETKNVEIIFESKNKLHALTEYRIVVTCYLDEVEDE